MLSQGDHEHLYLKWEELGYCSELFFTYLAYCIERLNNFFTIGTAKFHKDDPVFCGDINAMDISSLIRYQWTALLLFPAFAHAARNNHDVISHIIFLLLT